jgi:hypothetical protein
MLAQIQLAGIGTIGSLFLLFEINQTRTVKETIDHGRY